MKTVRVLLIGDVVGNLGCAVFQKHIDALKKKFNIDGVIVNGENSSPRGRGITPKIVSFFKHNGANVITSGNHIWANKDIYSYIDQNDDLLRPANFPTDAPGPGFTTFNSGGVEIGVINLQGRVFMSQLVDDPFKIADTILTYLKQKTKVIFVDFHAETTAEKIGIGYYLDGKVSCVVGTHTHVQTADERILPKGTAFISDLGMCGSLNSMIGMKKDSILYNMKTQMPTKFEVENDPPAVMSGVWVEVDTYSGKALKIERFRIVDEDINV
jgi:2',3'-cyclic-nucleotide 2'-phosphodiesterase